MPDQAKLRGVKPIQNELRKNKISSIGNLPGRKTDWRGERMELEFRKKNKSDRMMRSESFDVQKVKKTGWKDAESREAFPSPGWE